MRTLTLTLLLTFCHLHLIPQASGQLQLYCQLVWKQFNSGDPIPPGSIATHNDEQFVARVYESGEYRIGSLEKITGIAHIYRSSYSSFEILTNPNGCITNWAPAKGAHGYIKPLNSWSVDGSSTQNGNIFVGRGDRNGIWFGGNAYPGRGELVFGPFFVNFWWIFWGLRFGDYTKEYQILQSYSRGLSLVIRDFDMDLEMPTQGLDFLGVDELENSGEADISQSVTHTKRITESVSVTHSESQTESHTASVSVSANMWFVSVEASYSYENSHTSEDSQTVENSKETEFTVSREISVPPKTSVQACSMVKVIDNFQTDYKATGVYKGPGMSGEEVDRLLRQYNTIGEIVGDSVEIPITGTMTASMAMTTKFIVLPMDSMEGCNLLEKKAYKSRMDADRERRRLKKMRRQIQQERARNGSLAALEARRNGPVTIDFVRDPIPNTKYEGVKISMARYTAIREEALKGRNGGGKSRYEFDEDDQHVTTNVQMGKKGFSKLRRNGRIQRR